MPNEAALGCVAWNRTDGWVCCGGADGLVKVLRMELPNPVTGAQPALRPPIRAATDTHTDRNKNARRRGGNE